MSLHAEQSRAGRGGVAETLKSLLLAGLVALAIRTIAYEPFSVPSESTLPTLEVGDHFFISKYAYGYSRHSLPFSPPLFEGGCSSGLRAAATSSSSSCRATEPPTM